MPETWSDVAEPLFTGHRESVQPGWIDYNGHMNLAFYVLAFDHATDTVFEALGVDEAYRRRTHQSIFVAETHVVYLDEALEGDRLLFATRILGHGDKKVRLFHEMYAEKTGALIATIELMILHVDLGARRAVPFPPQVLAGIEDMAARQAVLDPPPQAGRAVAL
ncbi:MAG: thioesterase family protein [Hyphomicrobiales bacterium]|nr:thioesterase family protein [Hyphomicrobiales bacterium]